MLYRRSMMGGSGLGHWAFLLLIVIPLIYPISRILGRMGLSPVWAIIALMPLVNLVALWVPAFIDWPARRGSASGM